MSKPFFWSILICILIMLGLVAGVFADSIQRTLTMPQARAMSMGGITVTTKPAQAGTPVVPTPMSKATVDTMGMTIVARDTFQRANQALWGTASDGRDWQGDANTLAAFSIENAAGRIANGQGGLNAVLGPVHDDTEVVVQGTVNHYNGSTINLGVVLRWTNANNWYKLLIDANSLTILKRVNGVSSILAAATFHAQDNVTYSLRFRAVGAMLFAKAWASKNGEPANWMLLTTDTALTSGRAGIRVLVQPTTVVRITSFLATAVPVGT